MVIDLQGLLRSGMMVQATASQVESDEMRIGQPALAEFPFALWQRLERQTTMAQRIAGAGYLDPAGHPPLRAAIAQWLLVSRGIRCDPAQVLITAGSQQALDLIAQVVRVLAGNHRPFGIDAVAVEPVAGSAGRSLGCAGGGVPALCQCGNRPGQQADGQYDRSHEFSQSSQ